MNVWDELRSNLTQSWESFVLALPKIIAGLLIFSLALVVASWLGRFFRKKMSRKAADSITLAFIVQAVRTVLVIIGASLMFHIIGFRGVAGGILAGAGIGAVIIGFAFKEIGENFLAGIILVFDRPFKIGDTVKLNNNVGVVRGLKLRTTHLRAFDGKDVYVPNGQVIRNDVVNYTRNGLLRQDFTIGIDYRDDLDKATTLISQYLHEHPRLLKRIKPQVYVEAFDLNFVVLRATFWMTTMDHGREAPFVRGLIMQGVKEVLHEHQFTFLSRKPVG